MYMYICMYVYMHMLSYSIYAHTRGFRVLGIMYIRILCMQYAYIYTTYLYMYNYISIFNTFIFKDGMCIYTRTYIYMIVLCFVVCFL
jgi:hypothetical protein